ncbi:zona pellucida sperm-binding protein 3-like [Lethenteron reissneri]|uniref:zona pellucida sperm-binding protein 3-like n=1 Tax=Lethenteron reissneri TaxID=7753 RepID=UPI002AB67B4C|nr:zona pellucida sperm-binding protein 3-like [Lethenteron reissneri]
METTRALFAVLGCLCLASAAVATSATVSVVCDEATLTLTVSRDLFGTGHLAQEGDMSLGVPACPVTGSDALAGTVTFLYALESCGSSLQMSAELLSYENYLYYRPTSNTGIIRTNYVAVPVVCLYPRRGNVSSNAIKPTWIPFSSAKVMQQQLSFTLRLMTDDWSVARPSTVYQLGQTLHVEASVQTLNHVPLRIFVVSCLATPVPDRNSPLGYQLISNSGCLVDGKVSYDTHLTSGFLLRQSDNVLRFFIDSFRFLTTLTNNGDQVFIFCQLKVADVATSPTTVNKACTYSPLAAYRWVSADGSDSVCSCCESTCPSGRRRRDVAAVTGPSYAAEDVMLGPIVIAKPFSDNAEPSSPEKRQQSRVSTSVSTGAAPILGLGVAALVMAVAASATVALFVSKRQRTIPSKGLETSF